MYKNDLGEIFKFIVLGTAQIFYFYYISFKIASLFPFGSLCLMTYLACYYSIE